MTLRVKMLTDTAHPPCRADQGAAGYDLRADFAERASDTVFPGGRLVVPTGVALAVPPGCYGRIAPRSGLAVKYGIDVLAGVVDQSYRGEVCIVLLNTGDKPFPIQHGDRIAQLVLEKCETPEVEVVADLDATERGGNGFGSSGVR